MKKLIPFSLAMSMATASILNSVSPAQALTWTFSYESNWTVQSSSWDCAD